MLWITHPRGGLENFRRAAASGKCTVGYFGGSITDGEARHNWPHFVDHWLANRLPGTRIVSENIALGATGSPIGLMRCKRDYLPRHCDLTFVEFAVNDNGYPTAYRSRTREGLLRQLLRSGTTDVVIVYTFMRDFQPFMSRGEMPDSIREFEELCEHYNLPSVWMSAYTFEMLKRGELRYDEWLPDLLHPQYAGARLYAKPVCELLDRELSEENPSRQLSGDHMPEPLNQKHYEQLRLVDWDEVKLDGPFTVERSDRLGAVSQFLCTSAPGAKITVEFEGTGLLMAEQFGSDTCEYRITVDGEEQPVNSRERPAWAGKEGWLRDERLCEDLPFGRHTVTLVTEFPDRPEATGILSQIGMFAVV